MSTPKRLPILLWGDLREGESPVLRRALAGFRAHECMYAWVYLTEHLANLRLLEQLPDLPPEARRSLLTGLDGGIWKQLDRNRLDPHFQLSKAAFESIAYMACLAAQSGDQKPLFAELGSTFFTSRTRFEIVSRIASELCADWPRMSPRWLGIDNSNFMHDTVRALHGESDLIDDYREMKKPEGFASFLSRFVASYAFNSGGDFASWLAERFQVVLVEDAYSTVERDVAVQNHGQPQIFFSVPATFCKLREAGFQIYVLDSYPDWPAGTAPCHVVKYLALRDLEPKQAFENLNRLGYAPPPPTDPVVLLEQLNAGVSARQWHEVRAAKAISPVWGRSSNARLGLLQRARTFLRNHAWLKYRLQGSMAADEIHRAVSEEINR